MPSVLPLLRHAIRRGILPTLAVASRRFSHFINTGYLHTGERVCLDFPDEISEYHIKVYRFLEQFVHGREVLDVGCGTGYGSAILARSGRGVTAIDYSRQAIRYACRNHSKPNMSFHVMKADRLEFSDQSFDLVLSSEVFEHLTNQDLHLAEVARVMKPDGLCFIATPNPELTAGYNSFHVKENSYAEMTALLGKHFRRFVIVETTLQPPTEEQRKQQQDRVRSGGIGLEPRAPLMIFGAEVDTTHLLTRQSFFCFAKLV